jgi:hypothetical protein
VQRILVLFMAASIAAVGLFPLTGVAQTRKRTTSRSGRSSAKPKASEVQLEGATRIADQIKKLTKFIYVLGGVAKGLESMDDSANRNEASQSILEQAKRNKLIVRTSIQTVREGLDKLELDFRTTPELERYYIKLAGVAAGAANAEDQAAANQFDQAGRTLLDVVSRLTDALLEMR